ncbi:C2 domain-containing protein [Colletotrichum higginsianum]|nr:C2 domain-containing protein [Colletotrichum higginsianum]
MQLSGPVPPELYHRYVEFRPMIGLMFAKSGLRGRILNKALHKQHSRVYNFDSSTQYGVFKARSEEAALQFLKLVHFDEGGRIFTYVLTLDGVFRFTETGKEFSIDMLSKHTMHSDVETYIACSGEFFVRRLEKPDASDDPEPDQRTHPTDELSGGPRTATRRTTPPITSSSSTTTPALIGPTTLDVLEDPSALKKMLKPGHHGHAHAHTTGGGESSTAH